LGTLLTSYFFNKIFLYYLNIYKGFYALGTNKLDTCRIDVEKKEKISMAKENDDIRDIMDREGKEQNLDKSTNKNKWIAFYLLACFVVIYLLIR